jgi:hypothetical protein
MKNNNIKEQKMFKSIKFLVFMSLLSTFNFALSTLVSADVHNAATGSVADVQAAINAASSGDTVQIPDGNYTWSGAVSITNKAVTLKGNGTYSVNAGHQDTGTWPLHITISANAIHISGTAGQNIRVSGVSFSGSCYLGSASDGVIAVSGSNLSGNIRIDNCKTNVHGNFFATSTSGLGGLIDHCYITGSGTDPSDGCCLFADERNDSYGNWAWTQPVGFGGQTFTFIEDSTLWHLCTNSSATSMVIDAQGCGKAVVRHCYIRGGMLIWHGSESGNPYRGGYAFEFYNNEFFWDMTADTQHWYYWTCVFARGGTMMMHNNNLTNYKQLVTTWVRRSESSFGIFGKCDGSSVWDGNSGVSGAPGYPCLDQPGRGRTTGLSGAAVQPQELQKMYIWNNTRTGYQNDIGNNNPAYCVQGRDYEYCPDNSCAPAGYTPYSYPHPLQSSAPADTTPPANIATVNDGTGSDAGSTTLTTQLSANWTASNDPEGLSGYKYAIGTTAGGSNVTNWTTLGNVLTVTKTGLTLTIGSTYYFSVKAVNNAGLESAAANSNGQFVRGDTTAPGAPAAVRDGTGADIGSTTVATQLNANWDTAIDAESGIAKYYYAVGTTAGGTNIIGWTDNGAGTSVARTGLSLTIGVTYYFTVKAQNTAGLQGTAANSNGVVVLQTPQDTTAPTNITTVNDGTGADADSTSSLSQLSANWTNAADAQSGISGYKYAIGTTAGGTDIVGWTLLGNVLTVTKTGLTLTAGTTYYFSVKAVNGVDLESAVAKNSNGICVISQGGTGPGTAVISGVGVTNLTDNSATIIWDTDLDTKGQVQYGTTLNYIGGGEESAQGKRHMVDLKSLEPETRYHYRVVNIDGDGNAVQSGDYTFKTYALIARPMPMVGKVYPNPYKLADTAQMTFALSSATGGSIKIYTLSGKLVKNISVTSGNTDALWNLTNETGNRINGGLYVYIMSDSDGNKKTGKIVITN